jgi:signal transduction histidine kinase
MTRLYLRIYAALLGVVVCLALIAGALLSWSEQSRFEREPLAPIAALVELLLPPRGTPAEQLTAQLARVERALGGGAAVFAPDGRELARAGAALPPPRAGAQSHHLLHLRPPPPAAALRLSDGRWFVARPHAPSGRRHRGRVALAAVAGALALAALPIARSITRRLERVSREVEAFGAGRLSARAPVEGRDEVAQLALRFNRAAEQIEMLVSSQRALLASASHELRSPLARLRLAVELFGAPESAPERREELREAIFRDVAELDAAIEELLAVSRLDLVDATAGWAEVDLLGLAAEECARFGPDVALRGPTNAAPAILRGDARSLRHLIRNLLANAQRHAAGSAVELHVEPRAGGGCWLRVADRGPGIPEAERERIFEAFRRGDAPGGAPATRGAGLGLAIVRQIARHHGGDARALAREGGGALFEVELPGRA